MVEYWKDGKLQRFYRAWANHNYFDPPEEPDPTMWCEWCDEPISNDDTVRDGDAICPACAEYWDSNAIAVDFIKQFYGSMPELAEQCRHDDWMELFAEYMRECEPDMLKMLMKKEEAPRYQHDAPKK